VLKRFTAGDLDEARLKELCDDAYSYPVPLEHVEAKTYVMRLDRGPTASFKDFAARMMARWNGAFLDGGQELVILTATSGDTGSAVATPIAASRGSTAWCCSPSPRCPRASASR